MGDSDLRSTDQFPFFVYGTLRKDQGNYRRYLAGKTAREHPATLPGYQLYARDLPCVVEAPRGGPVQGDLFHIRPDLYARVLRTLDTLEGYDPAEADPWYVRVRRTVRYVAADGTPAEAEAWVYQGGQRTVASYGPADLVPDGDWIAFYRAAGQDGDYHPDDAPPADAMDEE
ncbi:MAG TPA: gamma-glutamylcyclotransferase family protein [Ktedonobacterales bacterium]|nr:gamma-glutamylcyclotransferase family protein [Ktedonobacterales bacterium]